MSDADMCDFDPGPVSAEGGGGDAEPDELSNEAICDPGGTGSDGADAGIDDASDGGEVGGMCGPGDPAASDDGLSPDAVCGPDDPDPGGYDDGDGSDGQDSDEPDRKAGQGGGDGEDPNGGESADEPHGEPDCEDQLNWDSQGRLYRGCAPVSPMENYGASSHLGGPTSGPLESLGAACGAIVEHFTSGGDPDPRDMNESVNRGGQIGRIADGVTKPQADQAESNLKQSFE